MKNYKIILWVRLIRDFFREMIAINMSPSLCIVQNKIYNSHEKMTYFKFELLGLNLNLKLKASDIVKNKSLLSRFSFHDRNDIIFYSGACTYRISDLTLDEAEEWVCTLEASFDGVKLFKKFMVDELSLNKTLISLLSQREQTSISKLLHDKKVINFRTILSQRKQSPSL